jgi:hypothetical protein
MICLEKTGTEKVVRIELDSLLEQLQVGLMIFQAGPAPKRCIFRMIDIFAEYCKRVYVNVTEQMFF